MDVKESLLVAQLSQVTIQFLGVLQRERRQNPRAQEMLAPFFAEAGYNQRNSLVNQGTIIGHAYLTIVWLWQQQSAQFIQVIPNFELDQPIEPWPSLADTVVSWENHKEQVNSRRLHSWLRHVRNALSHGRVSFDLTDDDLLVFADAASDGADPHTFIRIEPQRLGLVADLVIAACEQKAA